MRRSATFGLVVAAACLAAWGAWHLFRVEPEDAPPADVASDAAGDPESSDPAAARYLAEHSDLQLTAEQRRVVLPALRVQWRGARAEIERARALPEEERTDAVRRAVQSHMARLQAKLKGVASPEQTATICSVYLLRLPTGKP